MNAPATFQSLMNDKIHPVFHISQLKRSIGHAAVSVALPPQLSADLELIVEPEEL